MSLYSYDWSLFIALNGNKFEPSKLYEVINANIPGLQNIIPSSTGATFQFASDLDANQKLLLDSYVTSHTGISPLQEGDFVKNSKGAILTAVTKPEGSKVNFITYNFADPRTWYQEALKLTGVQLQHVTGQTTDYTVYAGVGQAAGVWIDNAHGRYSNEGEETTKQSAIPRLKVYVNGGAKTERAFAAQAGGDYSVDYLNHRITFYTPLQPTDIVTADVWVAGSSVFTIKAYAGKSISIDEVEVQYGMSISMQDDVIFEAYMDDLQNPGAAKIPIPGSRITYRSKLDFVNECNGSFPLVKRTTNAAPSERDLAEDMQIFKWDYKTETTISDSVAPGFELRVFLENNVPFVGDHDRSAVVATFYCRVM